MFKVIFLLHPAVSSELSGFVFVYSPPRKHFSAPAVCQPDTPQCCRENVVWTVETKVESTEITQQHQGNVQSVSWKKSQKVGTID